MPFLAVVWCADPDEVQRVHAHYTIDDAPGRLVGVFRYPVRAELKCTGSCTEGKMSRWTRDPKGFMKCAVCGGRHRKTRSRVIGALFDHLGANLLKNPPAVMRTPEGYR